jgi:hypothetical protein
MLSRCARKLHCTQLGVYCNVILFHCTQTITALPCTRIVPHCPFVPLHSSGAPHLDCTSLSCGPTALKRCPALGLYLIVMLSHCTQVLPRTWMLHCHVVPLHSSEVQWDIMTTRNNPSAGQRLSPMGQPDIGYNPCAASRLSEVGQHDNAVQSKCRQPYIHIYTWIVPNCPVFPLY